MNQHGDEKQVVELSLEEIEWVSGGAVTKFSEILDPDKLFE